MKEKNGFTLVEVLAVLAVLAILITAAGTSVVGVLNKNEQKLRNEMEENLKDAAISYIQNEKIILRKCSTTFDPTNPSEAEKNCYRYVKVETLLKTGIFTDDQGYCKKEEQILVYKTQENEYSELRAYGKEGICR